MDNLQTLSDLSGKKIHFIGIGGIGISGLARFVEAQGAIISGSDMHEGSLTKKLKKMGIPISIPHNASSVEGVDLVIHSSIIRPNNVEIIRAKELGIPVLSRKEALPIILGQKKVFAVAGAHGKSTTSAILSAILEESSAIIGAESKEFGCNIRALQGDSVVFEADESDKSFLLCNPYCAIVTNAEPEHLENYNHNLETFYQAYRDFLLLANKRVFNAEDSFLSTQNDLEATRLYPSKDICNIQYTIINGEPYTKFCLKDLGEFEVWGLGEHIVIDASLAILSVIDELPLDKIKQGLKKFCGIKKRFDVLYKGESIIIDDYAHHPTEIEATLKAIECYKDLMNKKDLTVIWQPHKYTRLLDNLEHFQNCFKGVERLIILPVYCVGEEKKEIDFEKLFSNYNPICATNVCREGGSIVVLDKQKEIMRLNEGVIVGFGAGDITYQLRGEHYE